MGPLSEGLHSIVAELQPAPDELQRQQQGLAIVRRAAKAEAVEQMEQLLQEAGMQDILALPKARVPVIKFVVGATGTKVDVTVNNILAIENTKLLKHYTALDPRLAQLVYIVKHWAKRRQVRLGGLPAILVSPLQALG
eukprot:jgi/Astpho2/2806/Aster-x0132